MRERIQKAIALLCIMAMMQYLFLGSASFTGDESGGGEAGTGIKLQMYNGQRAAENNTVFPRYKLLNTGTVPIRLVDIKIRYFYTIDGEAGQSFWCDWSSIGSEKITGSFIKMPVPGSRCDYFLETGFTPDAGQLAPGGSIEIHLRFAKTNWSNYLQSNDFSFNSEGSGYGDWEKAPVYINGSLAWGQEAASEGGGGEPPQDPPGEPSEDSPGEPGGLAVPGSFITIVSTTSVSLTWAPVADATGYDLEADGSVIPDIPDAFYVHTGLEPGTTHTYRVRAKSGSVVGGWSASIVAVTATEKIRQIKLQMYNANRQDTINSIYPRFKLVNTGTAPIRLPDVKIRYFYEMEGIESQNFWCDWSGIGKDNVTGSFTRLAEPKEGADYCLEVGFTGNAGEIQPGQSVEIQVRFANTDWSNYTQSNDYSFNNAANGYVDWNKAPVYIGGSLAWGEEPSISVPAPAESAARLEMYNGNRSSTINTVFPRYRLYNTGTRPIDLQDARIRYYYTVDGAGGQNFWCDWSPIGSGNVTGRFIKMSAPVDTADYCFETGFKDAAGQLLPGGYVEIQSRFAKKDWSNYSQLNDYSFNNSSGNYVNWDKVTVYIRDELVWGEEIMLEVPGNVMASATETDVTLSWNKVPGATGYDVEADGVRVDVGTATSYTGSGLQPGTLHQYRIRAKSNLTAGVWSDVIEKWTLPDIPGNISASSSNNSIVITWDAVTGATGYDIEVYGTAIDNGSNTSYTHTDLNPNLQQTYRVRAKNASGTGKWSGIAAGSTLPGVPANLRTTASEDSIEIVWDAVSGATGYDIEADGIIVFDIATPSYKHEGLLPNTVHTYRVRSKNSSGTGNWSQQASISTLLPVPPNIRIDVKSTEIVLSWDEVNTADSYDVEADGVIKNNGSDLVFTHTGLPPGSGHSYRVRAVKGNVTSAWSGELERVTLPGIPGNVIAVTSNNVITITWNAAQGAEGYDIEVDGEVLDNGLKTTYIHTGLAADTEHSYRVRARNSAGAGGWSSMVSVSTSIPAPAGLKASATTTTVTASWNPVQGASGYDLLVDGEVVDTGKETAYTHRDLEPNSVHVYRVRTRKGTGFSGWSGAVVQTTMVGIPSGLKAISKKNEITVTWNKVEDAEGYEIEADGETIDVGTKTSYTHKELETGTLHSYRVRAGNGNGMGDWSGSIAKRTAPPAPENLRAEAALNEITLTWDACVGAVGYEVEVNGAIVEDINDTEYVHSGLEPNTKQAYRVRAVYEDDFSEWSEMLEVNTKPELALKVAKDTIFNFVVVVPAKKNADIRTIIVNYISDELEVIDLCANTPGTELEAGAIEGTNITVTEFTPGKIVYEIKEAARTVVNMIRFISKTNDNSKVSYTIE